MRDFKQTWLCPERAERELLLEVDARLRTAQAGFWAALTVALLAFVPRYGAETLLPLLAAVLVSVVGRATLFGRIAPEYVIAGIGAASQLLLGVGIAMTGGARSPGLPVMLIAATLVPARFRGRGLVVLLAFATACMIVPGLIVDPRGLIAEPELLVACTCGMIGMAPLVAVLSGSGREHRADAALDALTGLPNRRALDARLPVLVRGAQARGAKVALLTCDVDHFKAINDTYGHVRGDRVLQAVASELKRAVRGGEGVYRWGGEEFVMLAVVGNAAAARVVAERVRALVAASQFDGLELTVSIGVALVDGPGGEQDAFDAADAALYRAKELGRDRVVVARDEMPAGSPDAALTSGSTSHGLPLVGGRQGARLAADAPGRA